MSSFWNFVTTMVSGTLARAEDVNTNLSGIDTGLNLVETELAKCIQITNSPGTVDIGENAAARANKIVAFNAAGGIELGTTIGSYRGNHANAAGTAYYVRDVVKDAAASLGLNNLYICTTAHTSTGGLLADTANWALLVDVASVVASEVAAAASAAAAATSYDNFDDRYLGSFTTAASPTLDNDGNAIITGALFFDTTLNRMKVRTTGATWVLTTANAVDVNITDAGGRITATEVEGALQEIAANDYTTNAKLANMATQTIKGRTTAGTGDPEDLTAAQVSTMLGGVATLDGSTLTNTTLTSPVLNGTLSGTAIGRGALVYKSANESIAAATYTHLSFNTESYDSDAIHDNVTNNKRLTVPAGVSLVRLLAHTVWSSVTSCPTFGCLISKNDETTSPNLAYPGCASNFIQLTTDGYAFSQNVTTAVISVVPGDYFTLCVYHDDTVARDILAQIGLSPVNSFTWFAMEIIK